MTQAIARIEPRLPYVPQAHDLGVNESAWRVLTESIWPLAKEPGSIMLALSYCQARNLDPFKRPIHVVPMWSSAQKRMIETVWPGISELRTTAHRTKSYAGCDSVVFGPTKIEEFKGTKKDDNGGRTNVTVRVEYPEWAQITVYRKIGRQRVAFAGPVVRWKEAYARTGANSELPNDQWQKRPYGQLEKCAEAAALRKAFPEEISEYTAEEMEGQPLGFVPTPVEVPIATPEVKFTSKAAAIVASLRPQEPLEPEIVPESIPEVEEEGDRASGGILEPPPVEQNVSAPAVDLFSESGQDFGDKISTYTRDEIIEEFMKARGVDAKKAEEQIRAALWKRYQLENIMDLPVALVDQVLAWCKVPPVKRGRG